MRPLDEILALSLARKGSLDAVLGNLTPPKDAAALAAIPDDRWLAEMARSIFRAGFNWKVVDAMWPGFETAFHGFDPGWCAHIADDRLDALMADTGIVRHGPKIRAVAENAAFVAGKGGFGAWVASYGPEGYADLLLALKDEGSRLGGTTGQYMLRFMDVDGWILSRDVSARLVEEGVVAHVTPTKKTYAAVNAAFLGWRTESGRPLKEISRILATSIG